MDTDTNKKEVKSESNILHNKELGQYCSKTGA